MMDPDPGVDVRHGRRLPGRAQRLSCAVDEKVREGVGLAQRARYDLRSGLLGMSHHPVAQHALGDHVGHDQHPLGSLGPQAVRDRLHVVPTRQCRHSPRAPAAEEKSRGSGPSAAATA